MGTMEESVFQGMLKSPEWLLTDLVVIKFLIDKKSISANNKLCCWQTAS
jgi:hypothetical protein